MNVMLWSTDGFPRVANGLAGFTPATPGSRPGPPRQRSPTRRSVAYLRGIGVRSVVVLPSRAAGTPWEGVADRPFDGLGITREEIDGVLVYRL